VYREQFAQAGEDTGEYEPLFCEAGRTFGAVAASGDVYPCIQLPVPVGNVYEKSFERIWTEAPLLEKMREAVKADLRKCATCRHAEKCYRCPGLAYLEEGSAFGPSPTACFVAGAYERYKKGDT
jgi:radical SAM protein with 4Fe4S-binding SPASM domain